MLQPEWSDDRKLKTAREKYELEIGYWERMNAERDLCARYQHNSERKGHWTEADMSLMKAAGRPTLTFNSGGKVVREMIGMSQEAALRPTVNPVGSDDGALREVVSHIFDRVMEESEFSSACAEVDERRYIEGEGDVQISGEVDPGDPGNIRVVLDVCDPREILWDSAAQKPNKSDARYVFRHRWVGREEFLIEYPEHRGRIDELFAQASSRSGVDPRRPHADWQQSETASREVAGPRPLTRPGVYADAKRDMVRLIHMEYEVAGRRYWQEVIDPQSGDAVATELEREEYATLRIAKRAAAKGDPVDPALAGTDLDGMQLTLTWDKAWRWLEFVGTEVLFDDESPEAFEGYSIVPCVCYLDTQTNEPYSPWRDLIDPSGEQNKRYSVALDRDMKAASPGTDAEEGAVVSQRQFNQAGKRAGGTRWLTEGGLARVRDRIPAPPDAASHQLLQQSRQFIGDIADSDDQAQGQSVQPEQPFTAAMRFFKSTLGGVTRSINYRRFQKTLAWKVLQIIVKDFEDEQIRDQLGNDSRYQVQDGVVQILEPQQDPETGEEKLAPVAKVELTDVKEVKYNIEFDSESQSNMVRTMELQLYTGVVASGSAPVDPEVILERLSRSRSERERLIQFSRKTQQGQAQQSQTMIDLQKEQMQLLGAIEQMKAELKAQTDGAKLAEEQRSNRQREIIESLELDDQTRIAFTKLFIDAELGAEQAHVKRQQGAASTSGSGTPASQ